MQIYNAILYNIEYFLRYAIVYYNNLISLYVYLLLLNNKRWVENYREIKIRMIINHFI